MPNTTTTLESPQPSFNWRTIPNWTIPQLALIRDRLGATILKVYTPLSSAYSDMIDFDVHIPGEGVYTGTIHKADMNQPYVTPLYWVGN